MPQRENVAPDNEYERPGRIAAYATISLQQITSSIETQESLTIPAFSEEGFFSLLPPIGSITVNSSFKEKFEEINLLDGLKSMDLSAFTSLETAAASQPSSQPSSLINSVLSTQSVEQPSRSNSKISSLRSNSKLSKGLDILREKLKMKKNSSCPDLVLLETN